MWGYRDTFKRGDDDKIIKIATDIKLREIRKSGRVKKFK